LRGDYKQSEYGRVNLPLVVLRRLDCVLELTKAKVLHTAERRRALITAAVTGQIDVTTARGGTA
jgi:type I restriction-modification system DNA methylase subunit